MLSLRFFAEVAACHLKNLRWAWCRCRAARIPVRDLEKALTRIGDAAARGAQIICLPELFQTQYFCQREDQALFDLAEPIPGPRTEKLPAELKRAVVLVASLFEKRAPGVYHNTAVIFDPDGRARASIARCIFRTIALLRKVLFHAG